MKNKDFKSIVHWNSKGFQKIVEFYLFECPVEGKSFRATTFKQQGWKGHYFSTLKSCMLKAAFEDLGKRFFPCKKEELESRITAMDDVAPDAEYCVFLKHDNKVIESLYSAIRNGFAHGSFTTQKVKKENIYFFANYDGYLKAQIQLRESTMLRWIEIFRSNPEELKSQNQRAKKKRS